MSRRPPYLEIVMTVAVMAFLVLIIAGTFNQRTEDIAQSNLAPRIGAGR